MPIFTVECNNYSVIFLVIDDVLLLIMAHDCGRDMRPALDIVGGHHYDCTEIRKDQENKTYEKSRYTMVICL